MFLEKITPKISIYHIYARAFLVPGSRRNDKLTRSFARPHRRWRSPPRTGWS